MSTPRWFERPTGQLMTLRKTPRLASWNRATDADQVRLRDYLDDTVGLVRLTSPVKGPWSLRLDVGLPRERDLIDLADLDNYALTAASRLRDEHLVSVWCSKRYAEISHVLVAPAHATVCPPGVFVTRTTASSQSTAYKEQVRAAVAGAAEIPAGPVRLEVAFVVGPRRNWLNLWKPTIDALDPLLGRTHPDRDWHPRDGRIIDLGLHVTTDSTLANDVVLAIAAEPAL